MLSNRKRKYIDKKGITVTHMMCKMFLYANNKKVCKYI